MNEASVQNKQYDVIIVGGGIVGAAVFFVLSRYTNIKKIALFGKEFVGKFLIKAEKVVDFFDDNIYFNYSDFKKDLM
jgi:thioredoxin reductase